ncbi:hypothetical protein [Ferrimicrobium acidiphilum]|jgi:hypothetical protein|uniref:hypothetical protein n=1 Tax=Ferrimicrobium acidiphilum TaxID=121039 RepID=UPI0023F3E827|nr:hypothetical protein [Ferrimicrobium acidiphilum]
MDDYSNQKLWQTEHIPGLILAGGVAAVFSSLIPVAGPMLGFLFSCVVLYLVAAIYGRWLFLSRRGQSQTIIGAVATVLTLIFRVFHFV